MKTLREQFEDNYMAVEVPCKNRRGFRIAYVYYGPWYLWDREAGVLKRLKLAIGLLYFVSLGFLIVAGLSDTVLNYGIVGLPVGLAMAAAVFSLIGVIRFLTTKERFTRILYRDIDLAYRIAIPIHAVLVFTAFGVSVYVWVEEKLTWLQAAPAFGYLAAAVCLAVVYLLYRGLNFRTEENAMGAPDSAKERNT